MTTQKTELQKLETKSHKASLQDNSKIYLTYEQLKQLQDNNKKKRNFRVWHGHKEDAAKPKHFELTETSMLNDGQGNFVQYENASRSPMDFSNEKSYFVENVNVLQGSEYEEDWLGFSDLAADVNEILAKLDKIDTENKVAIKSFIDLMISQVLPQNVSRSHYDYTALEEYRSTGKSESFTVTNTAMWDEDWDTDVEEYHFQGKFFSIGYEKIKTRPNGSQYTKIIPIRLYVAHDHIRLVGDLKICDKLHRDFELSLVSVINNLKNYYIALLEEKAQVKS
jgi:hypothetical protein